MASDIPDIPQSVDGAVRKPLSKLREAVQVLLGFRGDPLDAALTMRRMLTNGFAKQVSTTPGGPVSYVPVGGTGGTGGGGGTPEVDLTPPPNVPDFTASPGLTQIFVEWPAATYTQGNGHKQTNIYAVKKAASDPSLPTFSQATRVFSATGALTVASLPSDLSTRWHIWLKWETNDGVESSAPTGGTNGKVAQTGKIGNTDLGPLIVEAGNLANGSITPAKIVDASIDYQKIANGAIRVQHLLVAPKSIITDSSFSQGSLSWNNFVARYPKTNPIVPPNCPVEYAAVFQGRDCISKFAIAVTGGEQYRATLWVCRNSGVGTVGIVAICYDANGVYVEGGTSLVETGASGWTQVALFLGVPPGACNMYIGPWQAQAHEGTVQSWFADMQVEKRNDASLIVDGSITAGKIAANAIAVGTAAIQNGAIVNAMIGDAAIDNAKIASLSAAKVTFGEMSGDRIAANTMHANRITAGTITGDRIVSGGVGTTQIAGGSITTDKIGVGQVTADRISVSNLRAISADIGTFDSYTGNGSERTTLNGYGLRMFNSGNVEVITLTTA